MRMTTQNTFRVVYLQTNCKSLCRGAHVATRKVRTTKSSTPPNGWGSFENTASVTENYRLIRQVRVKTCGKSARLIVAT